MYYKGEGVLEDYVTAYAWWNIAATNGHRDAKKNKGIIAKEMTAENITKAEALVKEMIKKNPKLINK
jgi:TPR repeat protein